MKTNWKRFSIYVFTILSIVALYFLFRNAFYFKNEKKEVSYEVNEELVNDLYAYLTFDNVSGSSFYSKDFINYDNTIKYHANIMIYNYIEEKYPEYLNYNNDGKRLLKEKDYDNVGHKLFGKEVILPKEDFVISNKLKARYVSDVGFVIDEVNTGIDSDKYQIEKIMTKYDIIRNGEIVVIYDNFVICNKETKECYNNEKKDKVNKFITYKEDGMDLENNLDNTGKFKHTFKYDNGSYYWLKSEMVK